MAKAVEWRCGSRSRRTSPAGTFTAFGIPEAQQATTGGVLRATGTGATISLVRTEGNGRTSLSRSVHLQVLSCCQCSWLIRSVFPRLRRILSRTDILVQYWLNGRWNRAGFLDDRNTGNWMSSFEGNVHVKAQSWRFYFSGSSSTGRCQHANGDCAPHVSEIELWGC